ncbi:MAG: nuclear transport factor 2 family protein [Deltaproteobacteria bacterium]|nr:nuclear transport factor 2 family protein [Deltaproteobacteria bacterium]
MSTNQHDAKVNEMILSGQAMAAFEEFYADGVVMQENDDEPCVGKDANRKREEQFFGSVEAFHGAELQASAVSGDTAFSQWSWDLTFKGAGRVQMNQVAVRTWKDGKVVKERFYYGTGH